MTIYFLSGLGADSRSLKYLTFSPKNKVVFVEWLIPNENETLSTYAQRLANKINTEEAFMLVGLSFGGILATEIMEYVKPAKTILISSVARRQELPIFYRLVGLFRLNRFIPSKTANRPNALTFWMFGINKNEDKVLLTEILTSTNTKFSKWAVNEIVHWTRVESPKDIIRIHGNNDRVLPINRFIPTYMIRDAGHFMVVNRAKEISEIIDKEATAS